MLSLLLALPQAPVAPKPIVSLPLLVRDAQAISPDHTRIAVSTRDEGVWVVDLATRALAVHVPSTATPAECIKWNPDGSAIALLHRDGHVAIVNAGTGDVVTTVRTSAWDSVERDRRKLLFAADGTVVIAALGGSPTDIVSLADDALISQIPTEDRAIATAMALSPDGATIAQGDDAGNVTLWDTRTGQRMAGEVRVPNHDSFGGTSAWTGYRGIHSLEFSPSGHHLAIGGGDCAAYLWCRTQDRIVRTFSHCDAELSRNLGIGSVGFSSDGMRLITSAFSFWDVRVWDLASDQMIGQFNFSGGNPCSLPAWFSSDGTRVVISLACRSATLDTIRPDRTCSDLRPARQMPGNITREEWAWWKHDGDYAWAVVDHHLVVRKIPDEEPVMRMKVRER